MNIYWKNVRNGLKLTKIAQASEEAKLWIKTPVAEPLEFLLKSSLLFEKVHHIKQISFA